ncbi:MAG: hypothetical protein IJT83_15345 [Victivallales bacterium]|nr:hypothetical protein [Victivallales bacterium]
MKNQDFNYDVFPKVLKVGKKVTVTIRPKYDHVAVKEGHTYTLLLSERETYVKNEVPLVVKNGAFKVTFTPDMEQEYTIVLTDSWENNGPRSVKTEFCFYAVEKDLFACRPWKGDFHLHSCRSDGKESPVFVASNYRRAGFDFFALTDHHRYAPSLEVVEAFKQLDTNFKVFPGEEVHPPRNCVHHVNFGGSFSVNDLHRQTEQYEKEVAEIQKKLRIPYLKGDDRYRFASSRWVFQKIREAGGISILCHPYWITGDHFNVSAALLRAFFETGEFDALELIGGFWKHQTEANSLQVSLWSEQRAQGKKIPVVGISDSHGTINTGLFNWYYTIVFAPTCEFADLSEAIRAEHSVAVHAIEEEAPQLHGPFRYVKFAYFCLREILPLHHEECAEEGRLMMKYFGGDKSAAKMIALCKDRIAELYKKLWA